ncbi:putative family protein [Rosellinia necatrix]|uniref:Putative family protein n=1 Tax=Rosellinia necatrix TaxID=77044 RepID=A0A1W2TSH9_ROSNE|nr:putative family protein [Rosellinia necatrix]
MALKDIGVHLNECDWDNLDVLRDSIQGCDKLFLCLTINWDDLSCEPRQCQNILSIAEKAGVKQVVASTTLGVSMLDANIGVYPGSFMEKHMANKKSIERAVADRAFEHFTFLRPTFFMANFIEPKVSRYAEIRDKRSWTTSMTPDTQLPIVDHVDIAKFAAAALQDPPAFHGRAIGLASDQMRVQEILDVLAEAAGQPGSIRALFLTDEDVEAQASTRGFSNSHKVLRNASEYVNLEELRAVLPLTSFREFLEREKDAVKLTFPH